MKVHRTQSGPPEGFPGVLRRSVRSHAGGELRATAGGAGNLDADPAVVATGTSRNLLLRRTVGDETKQENNV